ncbi:hypothetical protein ALQ64_01919 [Pseudomonas cannabina]|uniref:Uncharacterized protein n=1 Tax=Pseudomonas cannabina TaxID=86840 RepID=A0A3M3LQW4_PSECA|nr:hypothetical protein [Pseudomonas cannabina]RMN37425.1 hypothetical protein ALQ64_01919 [Pseudomonas cannabina]
MAVKTVKLTTSFIGLGAKLFHVSLLADGWETPTMWLVAASDMDAAFDLAMQQHAEHDRAEFDESRDGYQIGEFAI